MEEKSRNGRAFLVACVITCDFLALSIGLALTWTSPVLPKLSEFSHDNPLENPLDEEEKSWIGAFLSLGAIFGPFLFSVGAEKLGRRWALLTMAVLVVAANFALAFGREVALLYFGRVILGLVCGGMFITLPTYIAELSEDSIRGTLSASMNNFVVAGQFLSYVIGPYVGVMWFSLVCTIPAAFTVLLFYKLVPETPQLLLKQGKEMEARKMLELIRSSSKVQVELDSMKELQGTVSFKEMVANKGNLKAFGISVALLIFQQFSGINAILSYMQNIFDEAKTSLSSDVSAIIIGAVQLVASFITPLFVDRYGRRLLFLVSSLGMLVSEVAIGVYFFMDESDRASISWLPVTCLVIYIITYVSGSGPLPWTVMAELLPTNVKAYAAPLAAAICWFCSFLMTKFFKNLSDVIGMSGCFWFFSAFNLMSLLFTVFVLPETKGKSAKEIQDMLYT